MEENKKYPYSNCGKMRTKAEGGTIFTLCDKCWTEYYNKIGKEEK